MANIYLRQMNELNVDVEQYSKLLDTPLFIVRKLVKGETLNENMGLNDFIRKNIFNKYNELEENIEQTKLKTLELKLNENQANLLHWYNNDFNKNELMNKFDCVHETELFKKMPIYSITRYENGRVFEGDLISTSTFNRLINKKKMGEEYLNGLLEQLYNYYTNGKSALNQEKKYDKEDSKYIKWWENFNLKEWLEDNGVSVLTFTKQAQIGHVTYYNIINKTHKPNIPTLKKIKEYVEKKENGEIVKDETNNEILKWYEQEFYKEILFKATKCKSIGEFYRNYKIVVRHKKASEWFYYNIIGKDTRNTKVEVIIEFAEQLKDIIEGNAKKYRRKSVATRQKSELYKWHLNFNYQEFMKKHNLTNKTLLEDLKLGKSTISAIISPLKKYAPADEVIKIFEEKGEKMEEIEIIDEKDDEILCVTNGNASNFDEIAELDTFIIKEEKTENERLNDVLKSLLKERLTDQEKKLIEIFGGKVC